MRTYVTLLNFTDLGIRDIRNSPHRADLFSEAAAAAGARVLQVFWMIGEFDGLLILEAPDDETAASVLVALAASGNVRTRTMRAYEWADFQGVIDRARGLLSD